MAIILWCASMLKLGGFGRSLSPIKFQNLQPTNFTNTHTQIYFWTAMAILHFLTHVCTHRPYLGQLKSI